MGFRWQDSASIAWAANSAPAKMYVHVSGGGEVSCASGVFTFATTGGVLDRALNGADYALGAMMHGADALKAVRIASRLDNSCGFGVDVVRF